MGFRFRRTIRILPGIRLNVSKGGISTSIGTRGATLNVGRTGKRATVGLPGTGLSYSQHFGKAAPAPLPATAFPATPAPRWSARLLWVVVGIIVFIAVATMTV